MAEAFFDSATFFASEAFFDFDFTKRAVYILEREQKGVNFLNFLDFLGAFDFFGVIYLDLDLVYPV